MNLDIIRARGRQEQRGNRASVLSAVTGGSTTVPDDAQFPDGCTEPWTFAEIELIEFLGVHPVGTARVAVTMDVHGAAILLGVVLDNIASHTTMGDPGRRGFLDTLGKLHSPAVADLLREHLAGTQDD